MLAAAYFRYWCDNESKYSPPRVRPTQKLAGRAGLAFIVSNLSVTAWPVRASVSKESATRLLQGAQLSIAELFHYQPGRDRGSPNIESGDLTTLHATV